MLDVGSGEQYLHNISTYTIYLHLMLPHLTELRIPEHSTHNNDGVSSVHHFPQLLQPIFTMFNRYLLYLDNEELLLITEC